MSVAVSNPYMNLAERAGGVMLREGRVPARALQLLVTKAAAPSDLGGWVIGAGPPLPGSGMRIGKHNRHSSSAPFVALRPFVTLNRPQLPHVSATRRSPLFPMPPAPSGCERGTPDPALLPVDRARTLSELLRAIQGVSPGLPLCWHTQALGEGPSCRIMPPSGGAAGAGAAAGLAECSVGRDFLQSFLDGLGSLNTFG
jgi:hypothetical protein